MSIRKIIFCDICNPRGIKTVEFRRAQRENESTGRRITESRAWIEGEVTDAIENGWLCTAEDQHICPICRTRHDFFKLEISQLKHYYNNMYIAL